MAFKKGSIKNIFYNKKFVLAFSLFSAFLFWLVITLVENPEREITFSNINISTSLSDQASASGLEIITTNHTTANVTLSGPSYVLSTLSASDISVVAQMNDINEAGEVTVSLIANCPRSNEIKILRVSPVRMTAVLDYRDTKQFTLEVAADGITSSDSKLTRGTPVVSNSEDAVIEITGPRSELEKVFRVVARTDVTEAISASKSYDADIVLYDAEGKELSSANFSFESNVVNITVPIWLERALPLRATFVNAPQKYVDKPINHSISVENLTILGPESVVSNMEYISLSAIDFDAISTANNIFEVSLELPNGVKCADNINKATVIVDTKGLVEKTLTITEFKFENVSAGLKASAGSVRNVVVCGSRDTVNKISQTDLYAYADLSEKSAGKHTVVVRILSKNGNDIWQVGTYEVLVTIE